MPNFSKCHEDCRKSVCFFCGGKAAAGPAGQLKPGQIDHIKTFFPEYDAQAQYLPSGICTSCRINLKKITAKPDKVPYDDLVRELSSLPVALRSGKGQCFCSLCQKAKQQGRQPKKVYAAASNAPIAPPEPLEPPEPLPPPMPPTQAVVAAAAVASASSGSSEPTFQQLLSLPLPLRERLSSATLKEKAGGKSGPILVKTGGRPLQVHVGPVQKETPPMPVHRLERFQAETRCSNNTLLKFGAINREHYGRKSVEPGLKQSLTDQPKQFAEYFSLVTLNFTVSGGGIEPRQATICSNMTGVMSLILGKKKLTLEEVFCRVGVDGGGTDEQGNICVKVVLSVIKWEPITSGSPATPHTPAAKKPAFDFDEPSTSKYKDTGEKQAIIIAVVPKVSENYANIKTLFDQLDWSALGPNQRMSSDLKMGNMTNGQQHHRAAFPCNLCTWLRPGIKFFNDAQKAELVKNQKIRTLGDQRKYASNFNAATGKQKDGKFHFSTVHPPLLQGPDSMPVMFKCPPPELHLMEGVVNHTCTLMNAKLGGNLKIVTDLLKTLKVYQKNFTYQGGMCKEILNLTNELRIHLPGTVSDYITLLEKLKLVKDSCFGQVLAPDYKHHIAEFKKAFLATGDDMYPKAHIIIEHVIPFCEHEKRALGIFSEQCSETAHKGFNFTYEKYKKNYVSDHFGKSFFDAVMKYNAQNFQNIK